VKSLKWLMNEEVADGLRVAPFKNGGDVPCRTSNIHPINRDQTHVFCFFFRAAGNKILFRIKR